MLRVYLVNSELHHAHPNEKILSGCVPMWYAFFKADGPEPFYRVDAVVIIEDDSGPAIVAISEVGDVKVLRYADGAFAYPTPPLVTSASEQEEDVFSF